MPGGAAGRPWSCTPWSRRNAPPCRFRTGGKSARGVCVRRARRDCSWAGSLFDQRVDAGVGYRSASAADGEHCVVVTEARSFLRRHRYQDDRRPARSDARGGTDRVAHSRAGRRTDAQLEIEVGGARVRERHGESPRLTGAGRHGTEADADRIDRQLGLDGGKEILPAGPDHVRVVGDHTRIELSTLTPGAITSGLMRKSTSVGPWLLNPAWKSTLVVRKYSSAALMVDAWPLKPFSAVPAFSETM